MNNKKLITKIKLKEANNLDTTDEYAKVFQLLFNFYNNELDSKDNYDILVERIIDEHLELSQISYTACCQLFGLYMHSFDELCNKFLQTKNNPTNEVWSEFISTAWLFYAFNTKVYYALIDYGNWEPTERIEKFENRPENNLVFSMDALEAYINYESDVHKEIWKALENYDKSKCMALSAYLYGAAYDIMTIVRIKQSEL